MAEMAEEEELVTEIWLRWQKKKKNWLQRYGLRWQKKKKNWLQKYGRRTTKTGYRDMAEMAEEEEQLVTEIWQKKKNWLQKYGRRRRTGYRDMA